MIQMRKSHENPYHPFYFVAIYVVTYGRYRWVAISHVVDNLYPTIFVAGYSARVRIEMSSWANTAEERKGKERWDYLNTVVSGVSCDPPGGNRWSPLEPTGPPQTRPSRRVTYDGHSRTELPPSSLSRNSSSLKGEEFLSNRLFEYRLIRIPRVG